MLRPELRRAGFTCVRRCLGQLLGSASWPGGESRVFHRASRLVGGYEPLGGRAARRGHLGDAGEAAQGAEAAQHVSVPAAEAEVATRGARAARLLAGWRPIWKSANKARIQAGWWQFGNSANRARIQAETHHAPGVLCPVGTLLSLDYQHGAQATSFELVGTMLAAVQASLSFSAPGSGLPSRVAAPATRAADPSMCGILATVNSKLSPEALRLQTLTLQRLIRHRGPDGSGINLIENADGTCSAIAHERLAIVDPLAGNQPLYSKVRAEQLSPYPCTQAHTPDLKRQSNWRRSREAQPQQAPPASAAPASSPVPSRGLLVEHSSVSRAAAGLEQQQTPRPADLQTRRFSAEQLSPSPCTRALHPDLAARPSLRLRQSSEPEPDPMPGPQAVARHQR